MDFINDFLVKLLDSFKAKNPKVFAWVQIGLVAFQAGLIELDELDIMPQEKEEIIIKALSVIGFILMALTGSRTAKLKAEIEAKNKK